MSGSARAAAAGAVDEVRFDGEPALALRSGPTSLVVLPGLGLTGVTLTHESGEYLALPGGVRALRQGRTSGLPLLAPWANRLSSTAYRFGGRDVDLTPAIADGSVRTDGNGLPIHGLLAGRSSWEVEGSGVRRGSAWLRASAEVDAPSFPFPHRVTVTMTVRPSVVVVDTVLTPTARRRVPVSVGWHPYLTVPGTSRDDCSLRLPAMRHVLLDARGIPTGQAVPSAAEDGVIGARTFDDLYELTGRGRALAITGADGRGVAVRCGEGYPFAQVWVPTDRPFISLEPMTGPTDGLTTGQLPVIVPGDTYVARFTMELT